MVNLHGLSVPDASGPPSVDLTSIIHFLIRCYHAHLPFVDTTHVKKMALLSRHSYADLFLSPTYA